MTTSQVIYRPGTHADLPALHRLLMRSVADLAWRLGIQTGTRRPTDAEIDDEWQLWRGLMEHLTLTGDQFWVAENSTRTLGYARSVLRDGVRELTELFVDPDQQEEGIGRELLARAMPRGTQRQVILASLDLRAQARYLKLGLRQVCAVFTFLRPPQPPPTSGKLTYAPLTPAHLPLLDEFDQTFLGHRRPEDHTWLIQNREGFLALRGREPVGYGYVSHFSGPFVLRAPQDYPDVLAHAETLAAQQKLTTIALDVPMLNQHAVEALLDRGFKMSPFFCFYMCDAAPHGVDHTIVTAPMLLL